MSGLAALLLLAAGGSMCCAGSAPSAAPTATPAASGCAGVPAGCAAFETYWWAYGMNDTALTAAWSMQPLVQTQLGGHCSALTPIPHKLRLSEWSQGAWPRLPQNDTAAQLALHVAALEAQLPHCVPDPEYAGNAVFVSAHNRHPSAIDTSHSHNVIVCGISYARC